MPSVIATWRNLRRRFDSGDIGEGGWLWQNHFARQAKPACRPAIRQHARWVLDCIHFSDFLHLGSQTRERAVSVDRRIGVEGTRATR